MKKLQAILAFSLIAGSSTLQAQSPLQLSNTKDPQLQAKTPEEKAAELDPAILRDERVRQKLKEIYLAKAGLDRMESKYWSAVDDCLQGLKRVPEDPELQLTLAEVLGDLKEYDGAEELFNRVIDGQKNDNNPWALKALLLYHKQLVEQKRDADARMIAKRIKSVHLTAGPSPKN